MSTSQQRAAVFALGAAIAALNVACQPMRFFARNGYYAGALPPRPADSVEVYFQGERPPCPAVDVGVIQYDAARDGTTTTQNLVVDRLREYAGQLGAHGVRELSFTAGPVTGSGAVLFGSVISTSVQEVGGSAVAYVCPGAPR